MIRARFYNIDIKAVQGDISRQPDITAAVNAANASLRMGGGVAGAIHREAGPGLEKECEPLAPIKPGDAVITGAHNLPNRYVIHTLGPVYGVDKPEDQLLESCYRNVLHIAEEEKIDSIAIPAISTGTFGFPAAQAADIALNTVFEVAETIRHINRIRFVLFGGDDLKLYGKKLNKFV